MTDPAATRARLRSVRRSIEPDAASRAARSVRDLALHELGWDPISAGDRRVGSYHAHDGELDPEPLASALREMGASTWYPVVTDRPGGALEFRRWDGAAPLEAGAHGIAVPATNEVVEGTDLSIVLVPLVGFDADRNRMGMGAGHYDRTFAAARVGSEERPLLIGIAHDEQLADDLEPQPWDVQLDLIVTPTRILR